MKLHLPSLKGETSGTLCGTVVAAFRVLPPADFFNQPPKHQCATCVKVHNQHKEEYPE